MHKEAECYNSFQNWRQIRSSFLGVKYQSIIIRTIVDDLQEFLDAV